MLRKNMFKFILLFYHLKKKNKTGEKSPACCSTHGWRAPPFANGGVGEWFLARVEGPVKSLRDNGVKIATPTFRERRGTAGLESGFWHGWRESNPQYRFWRAVVCH